MNVTGTSSRSKCTAVVQGFGNVGAVAALGLATTPV